MKILQFCKKTPIPPKDGESIAIHQLSKSFINNGCELTIFSLLTSKHKKNSSSLYLENVTYEFEKVNTKISYFDVLKNLFFSNESYIVNRFYDKKVKEKLEQLLQNNDFDIVQLEGIFLGNYIPTIRKYSRAKIVLRAHNIEHQIWERLAGNKDSLSKWYLNKIMIPRLKKFEEQIASQVDMIVPISSLDAIFFEQLNLNKPIKTLPAAYEIPESTELLPPDLSIGFIGGLDWQPNLEGINWFLRNVWTPFVKNHNKINFNLAGRNFPRKFYDLKQANLFIYGEVENAQEFTYQNAIMIAPILSGSGMRIKIIEALALGRVVISTSIGAEGIEYTDKKNLFIANSAKEWIEILTLLTENRKLLESVAKEGKILARAHHDIHVLGNKLIETYKKQLI